MCHEVRHVFLDISKAFDKIWQFLTETKWNLWIPTDTSDKLFEIEGGTCYIKRF